MKKNFTPFDRITPLISVNDNNLGSYPSVLKTIVTIYRKIMDSNNNIQ